MTFSSICFSKMPTIQPHHLIFNDEETCSFLCSVFIFIAFFFFFLPFPLLPVFVFPEYIIWLPNTLIFLCAFIVNFLCCAINNNNLFSLDANEEKGSPNRNEVHKQKLKTTQSEEQNQLFLKYTKHFNAQHTTLAIYQLARNITHANSLCNKGKLI